MLSEAWQFGWMDAIDISVVAVVVYFFLRLIRGTRAVQILIGIAIVAITYQLAKTFGLFTVEWMFGHFFSAFMVILVVLFQHEIRRALMRVAVNPLSGNTTPTSAILQALVDSAFSLAHRGWGGLLVVERTTGLRHLFDSGIEVNMPVCPEVIQTLFCPETPMHDGAVIITQDSTEGARVVAARVLLPLAQEASIAGTFGTRHRAAIGLSEESDALIIVVSEERGDIHLVQEGELGAALDRQQLYNALNMELSSLALPHPHSEEAS